MAACVNARAEGRRRRHAVLKPDRVKTLISIAAATSVLLLPGTVGAVTTTTLYVDRANTACSDNGPGTAAQPFCTIGAAARQVAAGQTVQVAAGTYPEGVTLSTSGTSTTSIVFMAAPGATVTLTGQTNGFAISSLSWITITGFSVTSTSGHGISVSNSSSITLSNNHVSYSGHPVSGQTESGIYLNNVSDSLVSDNTIDHNTSYGISLVSGSTRNQLRGNVSFTNAQGYQRAASGIRLYGSPGNTISGNVTHDNEDSGIEFDTAANSNLVVNNVTYNNGDHGIDDYKSTDERIIGNTVYKNVTAGINVEGNSTGATIANNISVDNGIASPRTHSDIRVETGSTAGTTMDYDVVFLTKADTLLIWDSVNYTSLSTFRSATGQEAHGTQADPKWRNAAGGDFHLAAGSPAIDSANSAASGQPAVDADGNSRYDDPATPNTGAGPRAYDDRGAYEFQPQTPGDAAPSASLTVSPASGTAPLAVTGDASGSTDTDATPIATYTFDFGDGSIVGPQAAASAAHTYTAAGTFTVTVTVQDTGGLASTASATVAVQAPPVDSPPAASLTVNPANGRAPLAVTADASGSTDTDATPIATYTFDFGDGSIVGPQTKATSNHTYSKGTFTATVTVTDTGGLASTATQRVKVR